MTNLRIGQGYDVHRLAENRNLVLGGITIPYTCGLLGHSDADVLTHAIIDALTGATGMGDIGELFPDTDPSYAGISSVSLLEEVSTKLQSSGWQLVNIDATVIAQAPKLSPYKIKMRNTIAHALDVPIERVTIKATTEEHLGFTGRGEGIAAQVIALVEQQ